MGDFSQLSQSNISRLKELLDSDQDFFDNIGKMPNAVNDANWLYSIVINLLTGLDMEESEASSHYYKILEHKYLLSEKLKRDIGFRVATLDYFFNLHKILKNPKFIEIDLFEKILAMSKEDTKTNCYNLNYLKEAVKKELKRAERYQSSFSILLLDIDNFKTINDNFGHLFGDKVLKKFVEIIKENIRIEDVLARYGGDEFIVLSPQTGRIGARSLAERIRQRLHEYFCGKKYHGKCVDVTFSGGIATYPFDAPCFDSLVSSADKALYKSKFMGKNRIYDFLEEEHNKNRIYDMDERRNFRRYQFSCDNYVEISNHDPMLNIRGKIINISSNGVFLECCCTLSDTVLDGKLDLTLESINNTTIQDCKFSGKIVRLNEEKNKIKFYMAMHLDQLIDGRYWNLMEKSGQLVPLR